METIYLWAGIAILLAGIIDFLWTTLWPNGGGGFFTTQITNGLWKMMKLASSGNKKILGMAGPVILIGTLLYWICSMWAGWALIFASDSTAFSDTSDGDPISWWERLYYSGYLLFTLGNGDYSPKEGMWQILSVLAAASGLVFITLGVTYVLSVLGALTAKRALAESIRGLGDSPAGIIRNAWNSKDLHNLDLLLNTFSAELSTLTAQHQAYPILHFYYSDQAKESLPLSVAILDETLTILAFGIRKETGPNELLVKEARAGIQSYLDKQQSVYMKPAEHAPPAPDLDVLREYGIPVVPAAEFHKHLEAIEDRRKSLLGGVLENKREWPQ